MEHLARMPSRAQRNRRTLLALLALALLATAAGGPAQERAAAEMPSCPHGSSLSAPLAWSSPRQLLIAVRLLEPFPAAGPNASHQVALRLYQVTLPSLQTTLLWERHNELSMGWPQDQLSPDGTLVSGHDDGFQLSLLARADGHLVRRFVTGVYNFSFAPDGRRIVADGSPDGTPLQIHSLHGPPRTITHRLDRNPSWSPDGRFIIFDRGRTMDYVKNMELPRDLYLLPVSGGKPRLLLRGASGRALWSPDGRHFALQGDKITVYSLNSAGRLVGKPRIITPATRYPSPFGWSRSGQPLVLRPGTPAMQTLAQPRFRQAQLGIFSPDGRYLSLELPEQQPHFVLDLRSGQSYQLALC